MNATQQAFNNAERVDIWPEPRELPGGLSPVADFEPQMLPEDLRPWIEDISERMQTPPECVAVPAMVGAASVLGRKVSIRPKQHDDWREVPNLWGCLIGRPGVMKSPAISHALKPVKRLASLAGDAFEADKLEYDAAAMERDLRKDAAKSEMKKALKSDPMADVSGLRLSEEESPVLHRYYTNDSSYQALGELLRDNPNGLLVFKDEVMGLLKPLEREENSEARAFYLQGWNGDGDYTFDRIGRGQNLRIPSVTISVLGGTQPAKIQSYVDGAVTGKTDDGLLQRFAMSVWPDMPKSWDYVDRVPSAVYRNRAFKLYDYLDGLTPDTVAAITDENDKAFPFLRFDASASERFRDWLTILMKRLRSEELHPALESHFAKYRSLVPSLALLHHLMSGKTGPVEDLSVLSALAWAEFLESHAFRIFGSAVNPRAQAASTILRRIKAGDLETGFSRRDIERKGWAGLQSDTEKIDAALAMLVEYGWLGKVSGTPAGQNGGRPGLPTYTINPKGFS